MGAERHNVGSDEVKRIADLAHLARAILEQSTAAEPCARIVPTLKQTNGLV
ncbi:MAG: hypothetical protein KFB97_13335 [Cyanobium sp. M30B3]|nr:MAG: hypothetical protein KFB97_13335 [Cyanobium sp. M30B3]